MRILLTGPSGFLGSALANYWAAQGHELYLVARASSRLHRIHHLPSSARVVRFTNLHEIPAILCEAQPEVIVHTACSYGRKGESILNLLETNVQYGLMLIQASLEYTQNENKKITFLNTGTVLSPDVSFYALSKKQFSDWGAALSVQSKGHLQFINILLQQLYGPGDDRSKFITHIIETCRENQSHLKLTAGKQRRDLIYIDDAVSAYDTILKNRESFLDNDSIDVGYGHATSIREFAELTKKIAAADTILDFGAIPYRENEAMLCLADVARLKSLGWHPSVSLEDGVQHIIKN